MGVSSSFSHLVPSLHMENTIATAHTPRSTCHDDAAAWQSSQTNLREPRVPCSNAILIPRLVWVISSQQHLRHPAYFQFHRTSLSRDLLISNQAHAVLTSKYDNRPFSEAIDRDLHSISSSDNCYPCRCDSFGIEEISEPRGGVSILDFWLVS